MTKWELILITYRKIEGSRFFSAFFSVKRRRLGSPRTRSLFRCILHTQFNREKKEKRRRYKCYSRNNKNIFGNAPLTAIRQTLIVRKNDAQSILWYIYYLQKRSKSFDWKCRVETSDVHRKERLTYESKNDVPKAEPMKLEVSERGVS